MSAQHVKIVATTEPDFAKVFASERSPARLDELTERLAHPDSPFRVGGWKQALSAFFNAPFLTTSWVALDVSLKPVNTNLAVDRVVVDKLEPGCYPATLHFGFNLRGRLRFLMDFFLVLLAFAALYALARYLGYIH